MFSSYGAPPPLINGQLNPMASGGIVDGVFASRRASSFAIGPGFAGGGAGYEAAPGFVGCGPASVSCGTAACCSAGGGGHGPYTYGQVPEGCGEYIATTTYKYVGMGAGNVSLFPVPAPGGCSCWWSMCFLWLLPLLLIPLFFQGTTTTTTTTTSFSFSITTPTPPPDTSSPTLPPKPTTTTRQISITTTPAPDITTTRPAGPPGICLIFGDPHVRTFDGSHASFYSAGEYWLVKSSTVWIQGRYAPTPITNGLSVVKEVAIGGPFLQSSNGNKNILRISSLKASYNGQPIIPNFPDQWSNTDPFISVVTDSNGETMQPGREGKDLHVVHVKLPSLVRLEINRWNEPGEGDYINVKIIMPVQPNQDGHCGNFNGDPADDTRPLIRSRIGTNGVDPANLLFNVKTPVKKANRPDLNDCPTDKAEHARDVCAEQSSNGMVSEDCMIDVCFGGDKFAQMTDYDE